MAKFYIYFTIISKKRRRKREGGRDCPSWMSKICPQSKREYHVAGHRGTARLRGTNSLFGCLFPETCSRTNSRTGCRPRVG